MSAPGHFARPRRAARAGRPRRTRLVRLLAGVGLAVGITALARWLASPAGDGAPREETSEQRAAAAWKRPLVSDDGLVERSGVRIVRVAVTGGGGLLDLRFQVTDADKAGVVHDAATPPAIVDEATGLVASKLLMGHAHTAPFRTAQTYYLIFENPGNVVHRGSEVRVLLGDAQVEHVAVQ